MKTTVLLVDDHELIRQGPRRAFERQDDFEVVGEAGSVAEASRLIGLLSPDVVIFDVRLPDGSGLEAAAKADAVDADLGIVILTMYAGDEQLFEALDAGASAFVPKNAPPTRWSRPHGTQRRCPARSAPVTLLEALRRRMTPQGPQLSPRSLEGSRPAGRRSLREPHLATVVHQREHHQDAYLEVVRQTRCGKSRSGVDDRATTGIAERPSGTAGLNRSIDLPAGPCGQRAIRMAVVFPGLGDGRRARSRRGQPKPPNQ